MKDLEIIEDNVFVVEDGKRKVFASKEWIIMAIEEANKQMKQIRMEEIKNGRDKGTGQSIQESS